MDEARTSTRQASVQSKPVYVCSPKLIKGMSEEDAAAYDASYRRAKTTLQRINQYARKKYLGLLRMEEDTLTMDSPNYAATIAAHMAQRAVWHELQELTRTT